MKSWEVTETRPEDARGILEMNLQSWHDTYFKPEIGVTHEWIDEVRGNRLSEEGIKKFADGIREKAVNLNHFILTAKGLGGEVIGWVGAEKLGDERGSLNVIYVAKEYHGLGLGRELMEKAMKWLGEREISVEVASYNERAKAFYQKFGFVEEGEPFIGNFELLPEVKMIRRLKRMEEDVE